MSLKGKIAVVTGGSRGIGRAICLKLAAMGAFVYINYVSGSEAAEHTLKLIEEGDGNGEIIAFDVADATAVQQAFKQMVNDAGTVDILVNNAGITRDGVMVMMKEDDWDQVLGINLKGAFLCSKAASRTMMKKKIGTIVNISSVVGFSGNSGQANYCAAKAGLIGLTKSMAKEYAVRNITVNAVAPGFIETEMTDALGEDAQDMLKKEIPLGRYGKVEDIAGAVAYLVSQDGHYITGQTLHVNGGMYM